MTNKGDRPLLLTVSEAAQLLATGKNTVYAMIRSGRLPCLCLGETRGYRIPRHAIEEWVEEAIRAAVPTPLDSMQIQRAGRLA